MDSEPDGREAIFTSFSVLYLVEVKSSICEQNNLHTDLTGDQTQGHLYYGPVFRLKTAMSPHKYRIRYRKL
jgi:hypothetical protein